jgi:ABC-type molybdate transport system substrate-binding protein
MGHPALNVRNAMPKPSSLPRIPDDRAGDLLGLEHARDADLVLFLAGNQFMAVPELLAAFRSSHPAVRRIFCETLPPGLELQQILAGGATFQGKNLPGRPDLYASVSAAAVQTLEQAGLLRPGASFAYLHNRLVLLTAPGNPAGVSRVADLGREEVRVSQPDPALEDIGGHILAMYRAAGGEALVRRIMEEKVRTGSARLTTVHHRETPARLLDGSADVGPVWATEAAHAAALRLPLAAVEPGPDLDQRDAVRYYACPLAGSPNPENGAAFAAFLRSDPARDIFNKYGFVPA